LKSQALLTRPVILEESYPYYNAFILLQCARTFDFNGNPNGIPMTEIEAFCNLCGYDTLEERHYVLNYIRICDKAYLEVARNDRSKA